MAGQSMRQLSAAADPRLFIPVTARILETRDLTEREKYYRLGIPHSLGHGPGQFVMVSHPGVGEAPLSICCGPRNDNQLELVVRQVGSLTQVLHAKKVGDSLGIRGPFGSGFDLEEFYGRDVLLIAGGLGLVPMRSLIQPIVEEAGRFGKITLIVGYRTPAEELFREDVSGWNLIPNIEVIRMVDDTAHLPWDGEVGLVTAPIAELPLDADNTVVALIGPPVMYKFVIMELMARNLPHSRIFVDLERRMKCGIGKCGHCQINHLYCCRSGPVFRFSEIATLQEAL